MEEVKNTYRDLVAKAERKRQLERSRRRREDNINVDLNNEDSNKRVGLS